jgi:hypothetical protein
MVARRRTSVPFARAAVPLLSTIMLAPGCADESGLPLEPGEAAEAAATEEDADTPARAPTVLAELLPGPSALVADHRALFLVTRRLGDDGEIAALDPCTGLVQRLAAVSRPGGLAAAGAWLYWSEPARGLVKRLGVARPGRIELVEQGSDGVFHLAAGPRLVAWSRRGAELALREAEGRGRAVVALAAPAAAIAVAGARAFVALTDGQLWRVAGDGGEVVRLADDQHVGRLVTAGAHVYWHDPVAGEIRRVAAGGGAVERVAVAPVASALAVAGDHVAWTDHAAGEVLRAPLAGGRVQRLVGGLDVPGDLVATADQLAWIDHGRGSVMAVRA